MKKIFLSIFFTVITVSVVSNTAFADSIILPNETLTGKITYILSGLIEINTPCGSKSVTVNDPEKASNDIVITKNSKDNKINGNIYYLDRTTLEISTISGILRIDRSKVKDIILFK